MRENKFQSNIIKRLKRDFPDCIVLKNDPNYIQGIPDLLVLHRDKWAALEVKQHAKAGRRPNQQYYIDRMNQMSYAAFIYPSNEEEIFDELRSAFKPDR